MLNFGTGGGNGNPGAFGLGAALPAYVPSAASSAAYAPSPTPASFNPATGTTRFQDMTGSNLTYDPAGSVPSWQSPDEARQIEYYYGIYNPQYSGESNSNHPQLKQREVPIGKTWNLENGFLTIPKSSITNPESDVGKHFVGGAYETRYGTLDHLDSFDGDPFYGRSEDNDRRASWEYNAGGIAGAEPGFAPQEEFAPMSGGAEPMGAEEQQLFDATLMAIDPNSEMSESNREAIISMFIEMYGIETLEALREEYIGSDSVPAMLTPGEVVVPKNKVNGAGGPGQVMQVVEEMNQMNGGAPAQALGQVGGLAAALGGGR